MSGFEGGRRPCYLHDLRKVLPDSSDTAMTAGELANANHWYSDAVDDKLGELLGQINRGTVSGIRLRMRGSKDVRYWLEEVTDGGNPIKKAEPKPSPKTSPAVKKKRRVNKTTRVQELLGALPRNEAEAATIVELCDKLKTSEKRVHNYLTKLRMAMEHGPYAGVHGEVMTVLENLHGGNPKAGTGPTITIGRYWFREDGVVETSAEPPYCTPFEREMPERPPEPEPPTKFKIDSEKGGVTLDNPVPKKVPIAINAEYKGAGTLGVKVKVGGDDLPLEMPDPEVIQALEGEEDEDSRKTVTMTSELPEEYICLHFDQSRIVDSNIKPLDLSRPSEDDFSQPFDNIGLPEPEKAVVLKLTEMEATILMDMIGVAMDKIPDLEAWRKVAAKVGGSTGG